MAQCVGSTVAMLRHAAEKRGVRLVWSEKTLNEEVRVTISEGNLRQILLNLTRNAIEAMAEGRGR